MMADMESLRDEPLILSFSEIKEAVQRLEGGIIHTPLCRQRWYHKHPDLWPYRLTHQTSESLPKSSLFETERKPISLSRYITYQSCAERGVRNALLANGAENCAQGVIVPSTGNMALAAAYHGGTLGVPVTVVLPDRTPPAQAQRCAEHGAEVVLYGENSDDAFAYAKKAQRNTRQIIIRSDDPLVMAGLGTVGVEIITQLPEADAVIVPVATGGLLASVLVACKKLKCSCLVYGAECAKVPKMMKALQAGRPVTVPIEPNLADGLNSSTAGANAFATLKGRLDRMLVVDEAYVARAVINVLEQERLVADGAGVCAIAAVMQGLVPELRGKRAVCVISGGNIDSGRLSRMIQRGLGASGRLMRFAVAVPDHRGGLEQLAKAITDENATLRSLVTEQNWLHSDVGTTWANVVVETANEDHAINLKDKIRGLYSSAKFTTVDSDKLKPYAR